MKKDIGFWNEQGEYIPDVQEVSEVEMDKEIIIDGVDVAGCKHYKIGTCVADYLLTDMDFSEAKCELSPDCYYKQLKQMEQENKDLKAENARKKDMIERQWKLLEQCGVSAGGELKRVSYLLDELREQNKELTEDNLNLSKENDRLKEENKTLEQFLSKEPLALQALQKGYASYKESTDVFYEMVKNYKQTLQEIKEIAESIFIEGDMSNTYRIINDLKKIITKAESEEE